MADPNFASPKPLDFSGLDALIAQFSQTIGTMTDAAKRQADLRAKQTGRENKRNSRLYRSLLLEMKNRPDNRTPLPPTMTMAEVSAARRQSAVDSASRMGVKRSILAGETGTNSGSATSGAMRSLLTA